MATVNSAARGAPSKSQAGDEDDLSEHSEILRQFREKVADVIDDRPDHDDHFLIRWLRARDCDIPKAEAMLRKSMAWREKHNVDRLLTDWDPPEVLTKYIPGGWMGNDKGGSPVWIGPEGKLDMKGITLSAVKHDIIMYHIYQLELAYSWFPGLSEKYGHRVDKVIMVSDLDGFGLRQLLAPGMDNFLQVMALVEANYPESLNACYVVNAPRIWNLIFNLCKPFLSEYTKKKIIILGADWKTQLQDVIGEGNLPQHWGGTLTDAETGDPYCSSKVCLAGEVPRSYYLCEQKLVDPSRLTNVTVAAGASVDVKMEVTNPNCVLKYFYKTQCHDIAFGVSYQQNGSPSTILMPVVRQSCHQIPETGIVECQNIGTYTVHFDNKFSWMNPKKLSYLIEVLEATEDMADVERRTARWSLEEKSENQDQAHSS